MTCKAMILDFDGVVLESNHIKDEAFRHTFSGYPQHLDTIMAYHHNTGGIIRFKKFKHICEVILGEPYDTGRGAYLTERFSDYVLAAMEACPFVQGAEDFLNYFYRQLPLFIVSVNPPRDLDHTLRLRKIDHFFAKVYATDLKKEAILSILDRQGIGAGEAVFIGDTFMDYKVSHEAGVLFFGRDSGYFKGDQPFKVFSNLGEIKDYLISTKEQ